MNKSLHRIVFNKARGILMAVAETAVANGKTPGTTGSSGSVALTAALTPTRFSVLLALGLVQPALEANAQIVADPHAPKTQQPTVLNAPNGVPVVNIQTPSAAGVSRNTYNQFDVGSQGAILNNSRGNVQSQLGGWVQGNPWLATGTARVVLNEVNATSPSQLRGFVEVAGDRAQVVIANAAGITCDGCGFLNATRATLTTGTALFQNGGLEGFRVQGGTVRVEGAGLDSSRTVYTDIIARAVEVNASIWASDLSVTAGTGDYGFNRGGHAAGAGVGSAPAFGIDVSQLGGMYAGRITLVGTEGGVGVRNAGTLGASAGEVAVDAQGLLTNSGHVSAATAVQAQARDGVSNSGTIYGSGDVAVSASGANARISNTSLIAAGGDLVVRSTGNSGSIDSSSGSILAAGLRADGTLGQAGSLTATASASVAAHGQVAAGGTLALDGAHVSLTGAQASAGDVSVRANQGDLDASGGTIAARGTSSLGAAATVRTDGAAVSADKLVVGATNVSNVGGQLIQTGAQDLSIRLSGSLNNAGGRIGSNGTNLDVAAQTVDNRSGRIEHAGVGALSLSTQTLEGAAGNIGTQGQLLITAGTARVDGGTTVGKQVSIRATDLSNRGGQIVQTSGADTSLELAGKLDNAGGTIASNGQTTVQASSLENRGGTIQTAGPSGMAVSIAGTLDNGDGGVLAAGGQARIRAGEVANGQGRVSAGGDLDLQATGRIQNADGVLVSDSRLSVAADTLDNARGILQAGKIQVVTTSMLVNAQGQISGASDITISAGALMNSGSIHSQGDLAITSAGALDNTGVAAAQGNTAIHAGHVNSAGASVLAAGLTRAGSLTGNGSLSVTGDNAVVAHGQNLAAGQLAFDGASIDLSNSVTAAGGVTLTARQGKVSTANADVSATGTLHVSANATSGQALENQGGIIVADAVKFEVRALDNTGGEVVQTGTARIDMAGLSTLDNSGGRIATNGTDLRIEAANWVNTDGRVEHAGIGALTIQASGIDGARGTVVTNGLLQVHAGAVNWNAGVVSAGQFDVSASSLSNRAGKLVQTGTGIARLTVSGALDNADGLVASNGSLNVDAGSVVNTAGTIQAAGAGGVAIRSAGALSNLSGSVVSAGNLDVRSGTVHNTGTMYADGDAHVTSTGSFVHDGVLAAKGGSTLNVGSLQAGTGSLLAAGMRADGSLAGAGALSVSSTGAVDAHGQNIAAGTLDFNGASIDLAGSATSAANMSLTANQLDVSTAGASVSTAGTLKVTANASGLQKLDNTDGELAAGTLDIAASNVANVRGTIVQTGTSASVLGVSGTLDNTSGRIASNGSAWHLGAGTLTNTDGRLAHAGTGTFTVHAGNVASTRGAVSSNGTVDLTASTVTLDDGVLSAERILLHADTLSNRSGNIVQTGSASSTIAVTGSIDNTAGRIASNGSTTLTGGSLLNQGGAVQTGGPASLAVAVSGLLDNGALGLISGNAGVQVSAGTISNVQGQMTAGQTLGVTAAGGIDNRSGVVAGNGQVTVSGVSVDNRAGTIGSVQSGATVNATRGALLNSGGRVEAAQSVSATALGIDNANGTIGGTGVTLDTSGTAIDNSQGAIGSRGSLDIRSGALNNDRGLVQATGALTVDTNGQTLANTNAGAAGGIVGQSTVVLATGSLVNQAGFIGAHGHLSAASTAIDNTAGGVVTGEAAVSLSGTALDNRGGQVQGLGDVTVAAGGGTVNNTSSLLRSGGTLTVTAAQVLNANTQGVDQGLEGRSVAVTSGLLDNTNGAIRADESLVLTSSGSVGNAAGLVSSGRTVSVLDANGSAKALSVNNQSGTFIAGDALTVDSASLTGAGKLLSEGDLTVKLTGNYTHVGNFQAAGSATLETTGTLTNQARLLAGDAITVRAANLDNTASGEISSAQTTVSAAQTLTNRGLIDGEKTVISGSTVNNVGTGRIYGDELSISAGTLNNGAENGVAATLAARARLDVGAQVINNSGHGLIFSAGDIAIGGSLDANHRAAGQVSVLNNAGSTIEALGNVSIASQLVNNTNTNFSTQEVVLSNVRTVEYTLPGITTWYGPDQARLTNDGADGLLYLYTPEGAGDNLWVRDFTRTVRETQVLTTDPGQILAGGSMRIDAGTVLNDRSKIVAGGALTGTIGTLDNRGTDGQRTSTDAGTLTNYWRIRHSGSDSQGGSSSAYAPAPVVEAIQVGMATYQQNAAPVGTGTQMGGLVQSGLNQSAVGANAAVAALRPGTLIEVRSAIGSNAVSGTGVSAATGASTSSQTGPVGSSTGAPAAVAGVSANVGPAGSAPTQVAPIASGNESAAAPQAAAAGPAFVVRAVVPNTAIPDNSLFRQNPAASGNFLVETDPRYANYRDWLSSDYLLEQLKVDPALTQKRLGDGFYEQKLVREQVAELTGRRFLDGHANDEAQYQALMMAGATFAKQWRLVPGVELTPEQMAQLTTDIVWLVERPVTLADGSVQKVLVPQVYVRVKEGDVDGSGALLSAGSMNLNLSGDLKNSGSIAGRTVVNITAENIANLGGRIDGNDVTLSARNDLNHLGGVISGNSSLVVSAGRDINVVTSTASATASRGSVTNISRVAALYVGDGGGALLATAGRDVNLVAATLANASADGATVISAGRDLKLGTVTEASSSVSIANADNWRKESRSTEVGTTVAGVGNVQLVAGRDIDVRAGTLTSADGVLSAAATNNISITAGVSTLALDEAHKITGSNSLTKKKTTFTRDIVDATGVVSSTLTGNTVILQAGDKATQTGDLLIQGSNVTSQDATVLAAGRDVSIAAAQGFASESHDSRTIKESKGVLNTIGKAWNTATLVTAGLPSFEGAAMSTTKSSSTGTDQGTAFQVGSTISAGSLAVSSGRDVTVQASTLVADGNLDVSAARNLSIVSGQNTTNSQTSTSSSTKGYVGNWYQPAVGSVKRGQDGEQQSTQQVASQVASLNGSVQLRAGETYTQTSSQVLAPKGDIRIEGKQVDIGAAFDSGTSTDSNDYSKTAFGGSVSIPLLDAARGVKQSIDAGKASGDSRLETLAAINAGMQAYNAVNSAVGNGGAATGIKVSVSLGHNESHGETTQSGTTAVGSQVKAGGNVDIVAAGAGKHSTLRVTGSDVQAGGNLTLKSEGQVDLLAATNTSAQHSKNSSGGVSVGVGFALGGDANGFTIDISASAARGKADGTDETHSNTHVAAGKTLTVQSGTDTTLKGAVASGSQVVASVGGNLNLESLQDTTTFDSKQESAGFSVSLCIPPICYGSGSYSANYAKAGVKGDFASVTEQTGIKAGDGGFQVNVGGNTDLKGAVVSSTQAAVNAKANTLTTDSLTASSIDNHDVFKATSVSVSGGTGGGSGAAYQKSGDQRSVTESGISDATVNVAGATTGTVVTSVRTDVDSSASLGKAWDGQKLQEQVTAGASVIGQFGSSASKLVGDYAKSKTAPLEDARRYEQLQERQANGENLNENDTTWLSNMNRVGYTVEQAKAVQNDPAVLVDYENWKEGGQYRVAAHAAVGAMSGNVQGALGAAASAAAVPGVANAIGELTLPESLHKSLVALAGTAVGAAVGGETGAAAGFNQTTNNFLKHDQAGAMKRETEACAKKPSGCSDEEVMGIVAKYRDLSRENIAAVETCITKGDVTCVQQLSSQAASRSEVSGILPFGYGNEERLFIEWQDNVTNKGSVSGQYSRFGTDLEQAQEVARFRAQHCSGISAAACDGITTDALNDRQTRVNALAAVGGLVAAGTSIRTLRATSIYNVRPKPSGALDPATSQTTSPAKRSGTEYNGGTVAPDDARFNLSETTLEPKLGSLSGKPERVPAKNGRGIELQNESAVVMSENGLNVVQLKKDKKQSGRNADYTVNGELADAYAPRPNTDMVGVRRGIFSKTNPDNIQASNVVVNLDDSPFTPSQVANYIQQNPVRGMQSLIIIKNGKVTIIRKGL